MKKSPLINVLLIMILFTVGIGVISCESSRETPPPVMKDSMPEKNEKFVAEKTNKLFDAVAAGDADAVEALLKENPDIDVNAFNEDGVAPIHIAVENGDIKMILALRGADYNLEDSSGRTPLSIADDKGNERMMEHLALNRATDKRKVYDNDFEKIHYAVNAGDINRVKSLIASGAKVNDLTWRKFTPLHLAARTGDEEMVRLLIESGADVSAMSKVGTTPLHEAAYAGEIGAAEILIANGATIDIASDSWDSGSPLIMAARENMIDMVVYLIKNGASLGYVKNAGSSPLHHAPSKEMAEVLLRFGADVNRSDSGSETPIFDAARTGNMEVAKVLIAAGADVNKATSHTNETPISRAATREMAELLVAHGADINHGKCDRPIHEAAYFDRADVVEYFLEKGVDPMEGQDRDCLSPLHSAAKGGAAEAAKVLIAAGADVNAVNGSGGTPLLAAADRKISNGGPLVALLLKHGADINAVDNEKKSGLHLCGTSDFCKVLIEKGININAQDADGKTALHYAAEDQKTYWIKYLIDHGADTNIKDKFGNTALSTDKDF